jgi:hypothetical protein
MALTLSEFISFTVSILWQQLNCESTLLQILISKLFCVPNPVTRFFINKHTPQADGNVCK